MSKRLSSSLEDYLEVIYNIIQKNRVARSKDISKSLGITNSSVSGALQVLSKKGLINYAPYEVITLTAKGDKVASAIVKRHNVLSDFFINICNVNKEEAEQVACSMEHFLTPLLLKKLTIFLKYAKNSTNNNEKWILELKEKLKDEK